MDERPDSSQQLMDILLVMDEKGTLQAVSGVKDGELQTKNPLEDNNDLLRVDRHGDMFSNFFSTGVLVAIVAKAMKNKSRDFI